MTVPGPNRAHPLTHQQGRVGRPPTRVTILLTGAAMELIASRSNAFVRKLRLLKSRGADEDLMLLEGPTLLEEALATGIAVSEVAASPRLTRSQRGRTLVQAVEDRTIPLRWLDDRLLSSLSEVETTQGILALAHRPAFNEEAILGGRPLILVAVGVQNPGNLGSLLRAAEAAGASGAFLAAGTADPLSWKALRGAMGSAFRLPHVRGLEPLAVLETLRSRAIVSIATVATGGRPHDRVDLRRPIALWLGNEGAGLPAEVVQAADERVTIPMAGGVESLNVAVAAGVLLFEAARQRRAAPSTP